MCFCKRDKPRCCQATGLMQVPVPTTVYAALFCCGIPFGSRGHSDTSRMIADSITDGVNGTFHLLNPPCRTTALGSTQPLTEESTGNISWVWGVKAVGV